MTSNDFTGAVSVIGGATTLNDANDLTVSSDYKRSRQTLTAGWPLDSGRNRGWSDKRSDDYRRRHDFRSDDRGSKPVCDSYRQCKRHGQVGRGWNDCESALRVKR